MNQSRFAQRVDNMVPSSIRQMMAIAKRLISEGKTVYELNIGQPDVACISVFPEAISAKAREGHLNYSPFIGETYLRQTYARYLNHHFDGRKVNHLVVDTENVLVTVGASHALTNTFLAICNPGDEILVIEPFFSPYVGFLAVSGGVMRSVPTFAEQNFVLPSAEEIEKRITPRTKAILFNSPNNPSGKILTRDEVTCLARVALKHDLFLIADEVYREMVLGDQENFSVLQLELEPEEMERIKQHIIMIDSASKTFALCGARIGFIVARPEIIEKISRVTAHTVASVSDLLQYGVAAAYDYAFSHPEFFQELRRTYRDRLEAAMDAIQSYMPHVIAPRPDGAFYLMIQFPEIEDIKDYCHFMLERFNLANETVCVTPASSFYLTPGRGRNEIRLALVVEPEKIRRSILIMSEAYKAYQLYRSNKSRPLL